MPQHGESPWQPLASVTVAQYWPGTSTVIDSVVAVKPPGPVHAKEYGGVPSKPIAVNMVVGEFSQVLVVGGETLQLGGSLTVTEPEHVLVQGLFGLS